MRETNLTALLLALLLAGGCGGKAYYPDGLIDAGPDLPQADADAGPDLPDGKPADGKPDAPDGPKKPTDGKPDAPDGPEKHADLLKPDVLQPHVLQPDLLKPDTKPADMGPDILPGNWVTLKAGSFDMGSPPSEPCRVNSGSVKETLHQVTLTNKFMIMNAEVTQADFKLIMNYFTSSTIHQHPDKPVSKLNWHQAAAYCNELTTRVNTKRATQGKSPLKHCYMDHASGSPNCSGGCEKVHKSNTAACSHRGMSGSLKSICMDLIHKSPVSSIYKCTGFRLPTEAEWEYAYRAGSQTALYPAKGCNGVLVNANCSLADGNATKIGWYQQIANKKLSFGKKKLANAWGLYDMAGNVSEWCHDGWADDLGAAKITDPVEAPAHTPKTNMVRRGGSIAKSPSAMRAAARADLHHKAIADDLGFRCVRTVKP